MSAWLNVPVAIIEDERIITEKQYLTVVGVGTYTRARKVTWTRTRYVGCDYAGAKVKADELASGGGVEDLDMPAAGLGQYHVIATVKVEEAWPAWA